MQMRPAVSCQKWWINISRVTASGWSIIRRIHRIWHLQISLYFFFFGFVKGPLKGTDFPDGQAPICEVMPILSELPLRCFDQLLRPGWIAWSDGRPSVDTTSKTE
jgi:hypothetical protein